MRVLRSSILLGSRLMQSGDQRTPSPQAWHREWVGQWLRVKGMVAVVGRQSSTFSLPPSGNMKSR